jgi:hypothetical protein
MFLPHVSTHVILSGKDLRAARIRTRVYSLVRTSAVLGLDVSLQISLKAEGLLLTAIVRAF